MAVKSFSEFLKEKNQNEKAIDWSSRKVTWLRSVDKFYESIETWFRPFINDSLLSLNKRETLLNEQYIGLYQAPQLDIRIGNDIVSLIPKGTIVAGGYGRIDLRGPKSNLIIFEKKWDNWQFVSVLGGEAWNVTHSSFQKAIQDVING